MTIINKKRVTVNGKVTVDHPILKLDIWFRRRTVREQ